MRRGGLPKNFWQFAIEGKKLLDPIPEPEIENRFRDLMPIIDQMMNLTQFFGHLVLQAEGLDLSALEKIFEAENSSLNHPEYQWFCKADPRQAATRYNENVRNWRGPGRSMLNVMLPEKDSSTLYGEIPKHSLANILTNVDGAFFDLRTILKIFCSKYQDDEFPFSPKAERRVIPGVGIERIITEAFVLTLDIVKGTGAEPTNRLKDAIIGTMRQFERSGFFWEITGNDAFVAVSKDSALLMDLAKAIKTHGEMIKPPGTRKGLSHGSVRVVTDAGGPTRIMDLPGARLLAGAFYMINGVDKFCENFVLKQNEVIIFEDVALKRFNEALEGPARPLGEVSVESKHFYGRCSVLALS